MQVYSQQLEILKPLGLNPEAGVWLTRDLLSGQRMVLRESGGIASVHSADLIQQVRLLRQLDESGFTGAEDVVWRDGTHAGFTARFVESRALNAIASEFGELELIEVLRLICQSMAYLHSVEFLHGDLKPDNILVDTKSGEPIPRLTDLGLAVRPGTQLPTEIRGSRGYMSPEILEGQPLTEAIDIFSFGQIVEGLASDSAVSAITIELLRLAQDCTNPRPEKRPQSFWDVEYRLSRLSPRRTARSIRHAFSPPLQPVGLRLRLRLAARMMAQDGPGGVCVGVVTGPPGIGKSKLIREFCLERQLEKQPTLRVTDIESPAEIRSLFETCIDQIPRKGSPAHPLPQWVFIETEPSCELTASDLLDLRDAATARRIKILIESRGHAPSGLPPEIGVIRVPAMTVRECTASSSHLAPQPALAIANGQSLHAASGGIPVLMRCFLREWLHRGRPGRPVEPVNFDHLAPGVADYWRERLSWLNEQEKLLLADASLFHRMIPLWCLTQTPGTGPESLAMLEGLVTSGWLKHVGHDIELRQYQFTSRSARNFIRSQFGANWLRTRANELVTHETKIRPADQRAPIGWELRRLADRQETAPSAGLLAMRAASLEDRKQVVFEALAEYRERRRAGERSVALAKLLSDSYGELGSTRRRIRWAETALELMTRQRADTPLTLEQAQCLCRLREIIGDWQARELALQQLLSEAPASDSHLRGYLRSELGAIHILRSDFKRARSACYEAHHLLQQSAPASEEFARNLNRLGVTLLVLGSLDEGGKYLSLGRDVSARYGWDEVGWRCLGNLGFLAKRTGNPLLAQNYQRRLRDHFRLTRNYQENLRTVIAIITTYVDLGQGYVAERSSRLAISLAEAVADLGELAKAHATLGWVLTMRGELGSAKSSFDTVFALADRVGDRINAARMKLNMARLYLVAADGRKADQACADAMKVFEREDDFEGACEANRLRARAAIIRDDFDVAAVHLGNVPLGDPLLSMRDRVETLMTAMARHLWLRDIEAAESSKRQLQEFAMVERVHPLNCEMARLSGHLALLKCDFDESLRILSQTATRCRTSGRVDHLMETMKILVLLAREMHNWQIGMRYLKSAELLLEKMRGELE